MPDKKALFNSNPTNLPFIDSRLADLPGLQAINLHEMSRSRGIYFLMDDNVIVYIGQSTDVFSRLKTHISEGVKVFNNVYFLPLPCGDLLTVEKKYILEFLPKYNVETKWALGEEVGRARFRKPPELPQEAKHVSLNLN